MQHVKKLSPSHIKAGSHERGVLNGPTYLKGQSNGAREQTVPRLIGLLLKKDSPVWFVAAQEGQSMAQMATQKREDGEHRHACRCNDAGVTKNDDNQLAFFFPSRREDRHSSLCDSMHALQRVD